MLVKHLINFLKMITFYKIYCLDENITDCYIGSTKNIKGRKQSHETRCNNPNDKYFNFKVYKFIRENGGFNNWSFKILNEVEYYSDELRFKMEQAYIDCYKPSLNKNYASRSREQWRIDNKEIIAEKAKEYREENKEKIAEMKKIYRKENKEKIAKIKKIYSDNNKEKKKEYDRIRREKDREKFNNYSKKYYQDNKEQEAKRAKEYREKNKEKIAEYEKKRHTEKKESKNTVLV